LTEGNLTQAKQYILKYRSVSQENGSSEAEMATTLGLAYSEAGIPDKAEEYFRQALSLEPENPLRMNSLAYFLIDKNRNINEGLNLAESALKLQPENYSFLDSKGWGLYKQGKSKEALDLIQKSWDLKPVYSHQIYLHLEEVKKTVTGQK